MRVLKFRIWDDKLNKFEYFDIYSCFGRIPTDIKRNIQQYTGLKDKEGREIYEGDIIIFDGKWDKDGNVLPPDHAPYEVTWVSAGMAAMLISRDGCQSFREHNELVGVGHTDNHVIGNIFENPELLKREN